jgi:hypothetical protein
VIQYPAQIPTKSLTLAPRTTMRIRAPPYSIAVDTGPDAG